MILYYRYFHSKGPIPWKNESNDIELNNKISTIRINNKSLNYVRSFKSSQKTEVKDENPRYISC